jgi:hypothetical protein
MPVMEIGSAMVSGTKIIPLYNYYANYAVGAFLSHTIYLYIASNASAYCAGRLAPRKPEKNKGNKKPLLKP